MYVLLQDRLKKNQGLWFNLFWARYDVILHMSDTSCMLLSNACLGNVGKLRYNLSMKSCGAKRRNKGTTVRGGEILVANQVTGRGCWLKKMRTRADEERVKACWEQRRGWGGLGGGEEKEQRNRKADVEEVGNWWSRKLGYSCCESMCLCSVCVWVCARKCAHVRVCVSVGMNGGLWQ